MKILKCQQNAEIATTLGNLAVIYCDIGLEQKALEINHTVLGKILEFDGFSYFFKKKLEKKFSGQRPIPILQQH